MRTICVVIISMGLSLAVQATPISYSLPAANTAASPAVSTTPISPATPGAEAADVSVITAPTTLTGAPVRPLTGGLNPITSGAANPASPVRPLHLDVPDTAATAALLSLGLVALELMRRRFSPTRPPA